MNDVRLMEKVAEVSPQHYDFLVKTAGEVRTSPFRDEIISELDHLIKTALDWKGLGRGALATAGGIGAAVGAATLGGIATALAGDMYDAVKRGITKTRNYKRMIEANPELKELPSKQVQKAFSVLHRLNPEFSGDPNIAGAWVKRQAIYSDDAFGSVSELKQLIDARKTISDTRRLPSVPDVRGFSRDRKAPPGVSKKDLEELLKSQPRGVSREDLDNAFGDLHDRLTQFEENMAPIPMYPAPGGGYTTKKP